MYVTWTHHIIWIKVECLLLLLKPQSFLVAQALEAVKITRVHSLVPSFGSQSQEKECLSCAKLTYDLLLTEGNTNILFRPHLF